MRSVHFVITGLTIAQVSALSSGASNPNLKGFFDDSRSDVLNLLNHPLQLQLATGDLPLGSFRRLVADRVVILEGLQSAAPPGLLDDEVSRQDADSKRWLETAESAGKTIIAPGIQCYNCGGEHLNVDCPDDAETSPAALALRSVLESNGPVGVTAVLRSYGFACRRLLDAADKCREVEAATANVGDDDDDGAAAYRGWLEAHAVRWTELAEECEASLSDGGTSSSSYKICLSMFYNWVDNEAATTGIRLEGGGGASGTTNGESTMGRLADAIEEIEPGYASQRDKHQSFVADITGSKDAQARADAAERKVNAAAAYLAAKKKKKH